ncbi:uncharacterized protein BJ171DRAFT_476641 [Polychytrium aggregatum]|uniref:uncharacterized protein n=1 Tax=Polychytrium aggregatum TaxID=110093 RepID=UPI0022FE2E87|nr:uncharacterized protein BJ171DRAFT_476641 [Polychytrium aggregatum]KAI9202431.1 hypothetical protein BJ171DRAFT_476641 [Polychytrium aggregatum]
MSLHSSRTGVSKTLLLLLGLWAACASASDATVSQTSVADVERQSAIAAGPCIIGGQCSISISFNANLLGAFSPGESVTVNVVDGGIMTAVASVKAPLLGASTQGVTFGLPTTLSSLAFIALCTNPLNCPTIFDPILTTPGTSSTSAVASTSSLAPSSSSSSSLSATSATTAASSSTTSTTSAPTVVSTKSNGSPSASTTSQTSSTATPTNAPSDSQGPSTGVILGGVAGGIVLLAIIIAIGSYFYTKKKYSQPKSPGLRNFELPPPASNAWKPLDEKPESYPMGQTKYGSQLPGPQSGYSSAPPAGYIPPPATVSYSTQPQYDLGYNSGFSSSFGASDVPPPPPAKVNTSDAPVAGGFPVYASAVPVAVTATVTESKRNSSLAASGKPRIVKANKAADNPDELSIVAGETITVLESFPDGWGLAVNSAGLRGAVPLNFLDEPPVAATNTKKVLCARPAEQPDEIELILGEEVTVLTAYDDGWGVIKTARGEGMAPLNFLS